MWTFNSDHVLVKMFIVTLWNEFHSNYLLNLKLNVLMINTVFLIKNSFIMNSLRQICTCRWKKSHLIIIWIDGNAEPNPWCRFPVGLWKCPSSWQTLRPNNPKICPCNVRYILYRHPKLLYFRFSIFILAQKIQWGLAYIMVSFENQSFCKNSFINLKKLFFVCPVTKVTYNKSLGQNLLRFQRK